MFVFLRKLCCICRLCIILLNGGVRPKCNIKVRNFNSSFLCYSEEAICEILPSVVRTLTLSCRTFWKCFQKWFEGVPLAELLRRTLRVSPCSVKTLTELHKKTLNIVFRVFSATGWRIPESNRWPLACHASALASWANPPCFLRTN